MNTHMTHCNGCGREIRLDGEVREDMLHVRKAWGYFSKRDLEVHDFTLCESCYEKLIGGFAIPVDVTQKTEVLGD